MDLQDEHVGHVNMSIRGPYKYNNWLFSFLIEGVNFLHWHLKVNRTNLWICYCISGAMEKKLKTHQLASMEAQRFDAFSC